MQRVKEAFAVTGLVSQQRKGCRIRAGLSQFFRAGLETVNADFVLGDRLDFMQVN